MLAVFVNSIIRWLRGYVIFTAKGKFPERLINLAMLSDIAIINPVGGKGQLTAQVSVADYKALYNIRRQTMTGLKINKKVGLPFILYKNRRRKGLAIGLGLFFAIINVLSMFIWSIDIKGNNQVSTCQMKETLRDNGVYIGAFKNNLDVYKAEKDFELQLGKVGWMSVNIIGSTASVELSESYDVPEIVDASKPCNLKAKKAGQIIKMDVREGQSSVSIGDGVAKGQLLVSGVVEIGETGKAQFVHSEGEVYAGVQTKEVITVPNSVSYISIKETDSRRMLSLMGLNIPIDFKQIDNASSRCMVTDSFVLNNRIMPISIVTEKNFTAQGADYNLNKKSAQALADTRLAINDVFCRWNSDIKSKRIECTQNKNGYVFTANYYCVEDIARSVPISIVN